MYFYKMFGFFNTHKRRAAQIFDETLAKSRDGRLYAQWGVPDTFDGRFDSLMLHLCPVFKRLDGQDKLSQAVYDVTFKRLELALRETGTGDVGVAKQVRQMMKAFYGRLVAYNEAQSADDMRDALRRNLYGTVKDADFVVPDGMIAYAQGLMKE